MALWPQIGPLPWQPRASVRDRSAGCTLPCPKDLASDQTTAHFPFVHECGRRRAFRYRSIDPRRERSEDYAPGNQPVPQLASTRCRIAGGCPETVRLRWRPRATHRPAARSRTRYRLPARLPAINPPPPGPPATGRVPGPPTQSIESAAGPRRRHRLLHEDQRIGRSSASLSGLGSATHRVTELESALRHRLRQVPSHCLELVHLAFGIWFGRRVTRTRPHSALAPKDYRRGLSGSLDRKSTRLNSLARRLLSYPDLCDTVPLRNRTIGCHHPLKRRKHPARMFRAPEEISELQTHPARVRNRVPPDRSPCQ